jgi:hypothetical protein
MAAILDVRVKASTLYAHRALVHLTKAAQGSTYFSKL